MYWLVFSYRRQKVDLKIEQMSKWCVPPGVIVSVIMAYERRLHRRVCELPIKIQQQTSVIIEAQIGHKELKGHKIKDRL